MISDVNSPGASAVAQSGIWVMHDTVSTEVRNFNHAPGGSNVLYMDGHVQFVKYPGRPPLNSIWAATIGGLSGPDEKP